MKRIKVLTKCSLQGFDNVDNFSVLFNSFNKMSLCCKSESESWLALAITTFPQISAGPQISPAPLGVHIEISTSL